ncbi:MAG: trehalose-phosphatase [Gammaproteobacteria bacterium]
MSAPPQPDPTDPVAVFLDFDGTLVHIAARPDLAHVPASLLATLQHAYAELEGALALITGRSIAALDALLKPLRLPTAGVHGMEFRDAAGRIHSIPATAFPAWARSAIIALAARDAGLLTEDKEHGMALHYRQAPQLEDELRAALVEISAKLGPDFILQNGKMVLELRPACATKGTAIARFMAEAPYAGRRPVFIGDDITDEDAFRMVNDIGGYSVKVGNRECSAARYELANVDAVRNWLMPLANRGRDKESRSR